MLTKKTEKLIFPSSLIAYAPPKRLADVTRHDAGRIQFSAQYPEEHHGQEEQQRRRSYKVNQLRLSPEYWRATADAAAACSAVLQHEEINLFCLLAVEGRFKGLGDEPIFRELLRHPSEIRRGACCFGTVSLPTCLCTLSPQHTEKHWQGERRTAPLRPTHTSDKSCFAGVVLLAVSTRPSRVQTALKLQSRR